MNEFEFLELEKLKKRQAELAQSVGLLETDLRSFVERFEAARNAPVKPVPTVLTELPTSAPAIAPAPVPKPAVAVHPLDVPPIIVPRVVPAIPRTAAQAPARPDVVPCTAPVVPAAPKPVVEPLHEPAGTLEAPRPSAVQPREVPPPRAAAPVQVAKSSFEMRLGTFWFVRLGIIVLLTGLALAGAYAYENIVPHLGPGAKVGLLYLAGAALLGGGWWLQLKEKFRNYGQVLAAGGLASVYFTTYAAHYISNLQVIASATADGFLLCLWAGFMVWLADRRKSEVLALFAVLLAYYSSVITHVGMFTLWSNVVLTCAAVYFLVRNRWAKLSFASQAATYISYAFWRFYQDGHWHLVSQEEGLWAGNMFLICYWIIFTAAVFLSRHDQLRGQRRAAFITFNNLSFFGAFIITMWQMGGGHFWLFCAGYGSLLLVLAALAGFTHREERLFSNTYLSQGLLLATLGIITRLSGEGLLLSLVLGVETLMLVLLGEYLKSRVMRVASFLAAALGAFWGATLLVAFNRHDLVTAAAVGGMMIISAFIHRDEARLKHTEIGPRAFYFTLVGLFLWLVATWQNTRPEMRGIILATEGVAFLLASPVLRNKTLEFASLAFGALGAFHQGFIYFDLSHAELLAQHAGLTQALGIGGLLVAAALWQRQLPALHPAQSAVQVTAFSCLGFGSWLAATLAYTEPRFLAPLLAAGAVVLTASYYVLRLNESVAFGQLFLLTAQGFWLLEANSPGPARHPWWNPVSVIVVSLGLAQWLQRQRKFALQTELRVGLENLHAFAVVGLLFCWLRPSFAPDHWLALTAGLAVLLAVYGVVTRGWWVALAGQVFVVVSGFEFVRQMLEGKPQWWFPLAPVGGLLLLAFGATQWLRQRSDTSKTVAGPISYLSLCYRVTAAVMSLWWIGKYIPEREQCWVLGLVGVLLFLLAGWRRSQELLVFTGVFSLCSVLRFGMETNPSVSVYAPNLLALLTLPAMQYVAKRKAERYTLSREIQAAVMVTGSLVLWMLLTRWIELRSGGFYLTVGWAAFSFVVFLAGLGLRERVYRWLGLSVLGCALGRVVFFDIWRLSKGYQIMSCLALGVVLLVLGFLYTKYQEKLKEWL